MAIIWQRHFPQSKENINIMLEFHSSVCRHPLPTEKKMGNIVLFTSSLYTSMQKEHKDDYQLAFLSPIISSQHAWKSPAVAVHFLKAKFARIFRFLCYNINKDGNQRRGHLAITSRRGRTRKSPYASEVQSITVCVCSLCRQPKWVIRVWCWLLPTR